MRKGYPGGINPALLAMLVVGKEYGTPHVPVAIETNPEKSPRLVADEVNAERYPNAKTRKRLGLPKPMKTPTKAHPKRYRRKRETG
jgi:hypothetical protein